MQPVKVMRDNATFDNERIDPITGEKVIAPTVMAMVDLRAAAALYDQEV